VQGLAVAASQALRLSRVGPAGPRECGRSEYSDSAVAGRPWHLAAWALFLSSSTAAKHWPRSS